MPDWLCERIGPNWNLVGECWLAVLGKHFLTYILGWLVIGGGLFGNTWHRCLVGDGVFALRFQTAAAIRIVGEVSTRRVGANPSATSAAAIGATTEVAISSTRTRRHRRQRLFFHPVRRVSITIRVALEHDRLRSRVIWAEAAQAVAVAVAPLMTATAAPLLPREPSTCSVSGAISAGTGRATAPIRPAVASASIASSPVTRRATARSLAGSAKDSAKGRRRRKEEPGTKIGDSRRMHRRRNSSSMSREVVRAHDRLSAARRALDAEHTICVARLAGEWSSAANGARGTARIVHVRERNVMIMVHTTGLLVLFRVCVLHR
jgi:hypothetical protein